MDKGGATPTTTTTNSGDQSVRDAVAGAFEQVKRANAAAAAPSVSSEPADTIAKRAVPAKDPVNGQFVAKQGRGAQPTAMAPALEEPVDGNTDIDSEPGETAPEEPEAQPTLKPPAGFRKSLADQWANTPREIQEEVLRRDKQIATALDRTSAERQLAAAFQKAVTPYLGLIQAEGSTPLQAMNQLFQSAAVLRTGAPALKAQLVNKLIDDYGVSIDLMNRARGGAAEMPEGQGEPPGHAVDPRFDAVLSELQALRQQHTSWAEAQKQQELATFQKEADSFLEKAEFIDEPTGKTIQTPAGPREQTIRDVMVGLVNQFDMPYEEAYNSAIQLHPRLAKVLAQREAAKQAKAQAASTQRAKAAASSIQGRPGTQVQAPAQPKSVEDVVTAAYRLHGGR